MKLTNFRVVVPVTAHWRPSWFLAQFFVEQLVRQIGAPDLFFVPRKDYGEQETIQKENLPNITKDKIGNHNENQNQFEFQGWGNLHIHSNSKVLSVVQGHEHCRSHG